MAHYAFLDANNVVLKVIVGIDETKTIENLDPETWYSIYSGFKCRRTSYNNNIRKQFAGIGFSYDEINDVFIAPKPYPSWILDASKNWQAPIAYPSDGKIYVWDEASLNWIIQN